MSTHVDGFRIVVSGTCAAQAMSRWAIEAVDRQMSLCLQSHCILRDACGRVRCLPNLQSGAVEFVEFVALRREFAVFERWRAVGTSLWIRWMGLKQSLEISCPRCQVVLSLGCL